MQPELGTAQLCQGNIRLISVLTLFSTLLKVKKREIEAYTNEPGVIDTLHFFNGAK